MMNPRILAWEVCDMAILCFIGGLFLGGITMMVVMSCIQINARDDMHDRNGKDADDADSNDKNI